MPKKRCCCRPIKLKKPKVTLNIAPVVPKKPKVSPTTTLVAQAILKKPDQVEEDAMIGVEPSIFADPLSIPRWPSLSPFHRPMSETIFYFNCPFPREFDHVKIKEWINKAKERVIVICGCWAEALEL